mmetsp:Transcript_32540/g.85517  ORF Transcript_32540/g.85517 Transcript_32540/m.85517 type:complete len:316 (+) Transcript_32540:1383-2330(+)
MRSLQRGNVHQVRQVGPREARCRTRNCLEVDRLVQWHRLGIQLQDLLATGDVGQRHGHAVVEAAGADERAVERLGEVGRREYDHACVLLEPIHFHEELVEGHLHRLLVLRIAVRPNGVDLIDEDDRRRVGLRILEDLPQTGLGLTRALGHDLGAIDRLEVHACLRLDGLCHHRLTRARRANEQHASRRTHSNLVKDHRVHQRQIDEFAKRGHLLVEAPNVLVADHGIITRRVLLVVQRVPLCENQRLGAHCASRRLNWVGGLRLHLQHLPTYDGICTLDRRLEDVANRKRAILVLEVRCKPLLKSLVAVDIRRHK